MSTRSRPGSNRYDEQCRNAAGPPLRVPRLGVAAPVRHGRGQRLSEFAEILHEFEEQLEEFLERLCVTAPAGHGRAQRLSEFPELLHEFEGHPEEFLGRLCVTASAGYGRAERVYEFFEVLSPFLAMLSLFLASRHQERDRVAEVAPTPWASRFGSAEARAHREPRDPLARSRAHPRHERRDGGCKRPNDVIPAGSSFQRRSASRDAYPCAIRLRSCAAPAREVASASSITPWRPSTAKASP